MFSSELLTRAGIAVSVTGHVLLLAWVIFYAGAHPFEPRAVEAIAVDIVTPDDIPQPAKQETPAEETPKPPDQLTLPELSDKAKDSEQKPLEQKPSEQKPPEDKTKPADPPKEAAAPPPAAPPPSPPPAPTQPPPQQTVAAPPPQAPPSPQPVPRAEPDITERFGMMFNMPGAGLGDFDAQAAQAADVSTNVIAALRAHLKTCMPLPKSVSPTDSIQFVLRVSFNPDGRLAADPMLIKGPRPTPKVLALLQGAISGLQSCQPYAMLPADKYKEWRSVDLTFTPQDFGGG